jgi:hypothetical protein
MRPNYFTTSFITQKMRPLLQKDATLASPSIGPVNSTRRTPTINRTYIGNRCPATNWRFILQSAAIPCIRNHFRLTLKTLQVVSDLSYAIYMNETLMRETGIGLTFGDTRFTQRWHLQRSKLLPVQFAIVSECNVGRLTNLLYCKSTVDMNWSNKQWCDKLCS